MRIEDVFGVLHDAIENNYGERLRAYLTRNPAPNWVIASDYVIGDKNRYRDTFCYTIFRVVGDLAATQTEIREKIPRDLKATSVITDEIVECLRSDQRFSFCFVADQGRGFFNDVNDVRSSIDATLEMVKDRRNWDEQTAALRRLKQAAKARSFNFKLFSDTILASLFAAIVAMFITKSGGAKYVHWFSDRDSMVTSYNKVAYDLLGTHFYQACYECGVEYGSIMLGIGDMSVSPWYDEFIRIPDFLAGALSAFDPETHDVSAQKHCDLLTNVISDAPQIAVIVTEVKRNAFGCQPFLFSRTSRHPLLPPGKLLDIAMTDDTASDASSADGAKRLVRILARRRRATSEPNLRAIFEQEGAAATGFAAAVQHALLHSWISRRPDGMLTGPRREGREAAGLSTRG